MSKTKKQSIIPQKWDNIDFLDLDSFPACQVVHVRLNIASNGLGDHISLPVMVMKGRCAEPVVGITAAVHGNEVNGLPIIHQLFRTINPLKLNGTIVGVPVVNIPGFLENERYFRDGQDLNRLFPGKKDGNRSEFYAYQFVERIARHFGYLIDLHTASFGRINSLYVRANLQNEVTEKMALLQHPQIVVNKEGDDGTLRNTLTDLGIPSITVEVGNPSLFQKKLISKSLLGLNNVLSYLKMVPRPEKLSLEKPIICKESHWLYTDHGGILEVLPGLVDFVKKGDLIATVRDAFGEVSARYYSPYDGVVIGKSTNPIGEAGARILHIGIVK